MHCFVLPSAPRRARVATLAVLLALAGLGAACSGAPEAQPTPRPSDETVVARYADRTISRAELDSAFVAAAGGPRAAADSSAAAYRDFLDRYLNFRLTVQAAKDAGLDTLASIRTEVQTYQQELVRPQLLRAEVYAPLARALYERRTEAVDVSHILIRIPSSDDTLSAYRRAQALADSAERGEPFGALASRHSDDPTAQRHGRNGARGRLGYLRAGEVPKPFEDRMYTLTPGETSDVFRTKYGYHVLKVHDRRPASPRVQVAHILRRPRGDSAAARRLLDSLRTDLAAGTLTFAEAARAYSQDPQSASKGGALGEVSPSALPPTLREAVAALDSVGALSPVVRSRFGYHLLKLTSREERPTFDEAYEDLKRRIVGRPEARRRKTAFARRLRREIGTTVDTARILEAAQVRTVDTLARPLLTYADTAAGPPLTGTTLGDSAYSVAQMARHLTQTDGGARATIADLVASFLNAKAIRYAVARRAQRDPAFARQVDHYREEALAFRYVQDSIWTAAARDTAGLRPTYQRHRARYRFPPRVRTIIFRAPADSLLQPLHSMHQRDTSTASIVRAASTAPLVSTDTVFVTDHTAEVYRPVLSLADGAALAPTAVRDEWMYMIRETRLPSRPKSFEAARSGVVQDPRSVYEQTMMRRLRSRYHAVLFQERLRPPTSPDDPARP